MHSAGLSTVQILSNTRVICAPIAQNYQHIATYINKTPTCHKQDTDIAHTGHQCDTNRADIATTGHQHGNNRTLTQNKQDTKMAQTRHWHCTHRTAM